MNDQQQDVPPCNKCGAILPPLGKGESRCEEGYLCRECFFQQEDNSTISETVTISRECAEWHLEHMLGKEVALQEIVLYGPKPPEGDHTDYTTDEWKQHFKEELEECKEHRQQLKKAIEEKQK